MPPTRTSTWSAVASPMPPRSTRSAEADVAWRGRRRSSDGSAGVVADGAVIGDLGGCVRERRRAASAATRPASLPRRRPALTPAGRPECPRPDGARRHVRRAGSTPSARPVRLSSAPDRIRPMAAIAGSCHPDARPGGPHGPSRAPAAAGRPAEQAPSAGSSSRSCSAVGLWPAASSRAGCIGAVAADARAGRDRVDIAVARRPPPARPTPSASPGANARAVGQRGAVRVPAARRPSPRPSSSRRRSPASRSSPRSRTGA